MLAAAKHAIREGVGLTGCMYSVHVLVLVHVQVLKHVYRECKVLDGQVYGVCSVM